MARQIKESDWKLPRQMAPVALERFCHRTLAEIDGIASDGTRSYHQRYLAIFAVVRNRDKEIAKAFDNLRRSTALLQLSIIYSYGLLHDEEFLRFSAKTREAVALFIGKPPMPSPATWALTYSGLPSHVGKITGLCSVE